MGIDDKFWVNVFSIILISIFVQVGDGQTRYKDIVFPSISVTQNIRFGSNLNIDGSIDSLFLDLYGPAADTLTTRPLVICIHGGSLTSGVRTEMTPYCTDFAQRGYVAATIDYRLGIESPKGVRTILEALLRGVQDAKSAVRFFRSHAAAYGIDTSQIFIEGSSAGSMIADHYAYWNESEIPSDINQAKWGDIEGTSGNPGYPTSIKGVTNYCGGLVDPHWINAGEPPFASIDGLEDTIVPQDSGVSGDFGIMLYGGISMSRIASPLGIYNQGVFFPGQGHGGGVDSLQGFASNFFYALMILASSSPSDYTSMNLSDHSLKVFRYDSHSFFVNALDKSENSIMMPQSMIQYACDTRIGAITPYGLFTPSDHADSGYVYARINTTKDSCYVKTYDFKYFVIRPKLAVVDTLRTLTLNIDTFDADSVQHTLAITKFTLVSTNPTVGTIDSNGTFTGRNTGTTHIIASYNGYSDTSVVRVENASGIVSFDPLESLNGWTFNGSNLDSLSVTLATDQKSAGNASFMIHYVFTYDPSKLSYMIYLNKDLLVYGIPDSLYLDVKSDGRNHRLYYRFSDSESQLFRASGKKFLNDDVAFDTINAPLKGMSPLGSVTQVSYPLTLKRIEIQLAGNSVQGQTTSGTIYMDNLRLKYPGSATGVEENRALPAIYTLEQNYPNPFNPSTSIRFSIRERSRVRVTIFNLLGQEVAEMANEEMPAGNFERVWAAKVSSGIYFYRLSAVSVNDPHMRFVDVKKMILLK